MDWTTFIIDGDISWTDGYSQSLVHVESDIGEDEDGNTVLSPWGMTNASALVPNAYGVAETNEEATICNGECGCLWN